MKKCECGGIWYRHGVCPSKRLGDGVRYRCKDCGKCITVRNGEITDSRQIKDWRHGVEESGSSSPDLRGVSTSTGGERGQVQVPSASRVEQGRGV